MDERLSGLPGIADLFRHKYCEGDHTQCARHILAELVGRDRVPSRLMPNDHDSAAGNVRDYPYPA
jgi:hypothetical protein